MAYPPYLARITHFQFDANAGLDAPSPSGVDSELNAVVEAMNQQNLAIRRVTTPSGVLKNLSSATAQALAGTQVFTATDAQTNFDTSIVWSAAFSALNVQVYVNATKLATSAVTVADNSGTLRVTLAAQALGNIVEVWAFESGAGVLTRLQTVSATDGANLLAIEDAGGYTTAATVEDAIQELYDHTQGAAGKTWLEGVLVKSDYVLKAGSTMASAAHLTFQGGGTVKGLPASAANGEAVRHEQVVALQTSITGITATFMPKSGGTFTGAVSMNSQVLNGLATPTTSDGAANKGYVDTTLASFGGLPVGTMVDFAGASAPTGWLLCDGAAVSRTTYASLFAVIGVVHGIGDGTTTFNVPDMRGRVSIGTGTGSGLTARTLGASGGEEAHVLLEAELPVHDHDGWSGSQTTTSPPVSLPDMTFASGNRGPSLATTGNAGSGAAHNTMPPFRAVTKIIKY